ncbi:MAG: hypothetical protein CSA53_01470 [Gammaproteobacteria bacterium]|nr:MAG: hypothetical protein CSA53_01470 [Gammaproteobacteria bacterium]
MANSFTLLSFVWRFVLALLVVLATFNPTDYCFYHWSMAPTTQFGPVIALSGLVLLTGWIVVLRATWASIGILGVLLGAAFFGCIVWLLIDIGWIKLQDTNALTWLGLVILALILTFGMSWSHLRRRLTGQLDVDEIED